MTPPDLAGIIERDRKPPRCPAAVDRRALLGLLRETREAGNAALTDFIYAHGSDFDPAEWPGMAALRAALGES